ncbi:MAG: glutamine-hydrolyzing GMP synthase [Dethiobacteria bacterium]|jgi:GMP synthase (glutamine-hydrolysing)
MQTLEKVLILDFGGQSTQYLARAVREMQVYCEIMPYDISFERLTAARPSALIFSGDSGEMEQNIPAYNSRLYQLQIPILGVGSGMQALAGDLGGKVEFFSREAADDSFFAFKKEAELFKGLGSGLKNWGDSRLRVKRMPAGFNVIAESSEPAVVAIAADGERKIYGLPFNPESVLSAEGRQILHNFLFKICRFSGEWTVNNFVTYSIEEIKKKVGPRGRAVCGLSGGIDSAVAALLVHRAVGSALTCIFVDNGLLRKGEKEQVHNIFAKQFNLNIITVDAAPEFLGLLQGVTEPEKKRKIIGHQFIDIFAREAEKLGGADFLVQGTLYSDVVESGTAAAAMIKSHHNVGGLPAEMPFALLEPLRYLFKDEVRRVAAELGLPEEITWRHPFPGPGLAVRILGEVTPEKIAILQEADDIIYTEIKKAGLYREIWQVFAVLPGILSVGVKEGHRIYAHTVAMRAVTSEDGVTADWYPFSPDVLRTIADRIVQEIPQVNRFVYDLTPKPPATIEWE